MKMILVACVLWALGCGEADRSTRPEGARSDAAAGVDEPEPTGSGTTNTDPPRDRTGPRPPIDSYQKVRLTEEDVEQGRYKKYMGGKAETWDRRGAFQLHLARELGLEPSHKFIDIGCGPIRGGVHLIDYLEAGNYWGFDYNEDFISAAKQIVRDQGLETKRPTLLTVQEFDPTPLDSDFEFGLVFSVLQHTNEHNKRRFFEMIDEAFHPGAKVIITHAKWFDESYLESGVFEVTRALDSLAVLGSDETPIDWGWDPEKRDRMFPIVELTRVR